MPGQVPLPVAKGVSGLSGLSWGSSFPAFAPGWSPAPREEALPGTDSSWGAALGRRALLHPPFALARVVSRVSARVPRGKPSVSLGNCTGEGDGVVRAGSRAGSARDDSPSACVDVFICPDRYQGD